MTLRLRLDGTRAVKETLPVLALKDTLCLTFDFVRKLTFFFLGMTVNGSGFCLNVVGLSCG